MKKVLSALIAWSLCCGLAVAAPPTQYSATVVTTASGTTSTSKQYIDNGKMRVETQTGGQKVISIIRPDKKVVYSVMVAQKMYMMMPMNNTNSQSSSMPANATYKKLSNETVAGKKTEKTQILVNNKPSGLVWLEVGSQMPIQFQSQDGKVKTTYKDVKVGPQAATLFDPPSGYKKMSMPGAH